MSVAAITRTPVSARERAVSTARRPKVAYIMSRFPKITETFVLYEMLAVEKQGVAVEVYPLLRERTKVMHPEAVPMVERAHFQPFISWTILCAHWHFLRTSPRKYFGTLWSLLRGTWGSFRFFTGALGLFPKTVYFARSMAAEGVTHVHAHFASHPAAAAYVIGRLTGIPYSFTGHGSDLHRDRRMLEEKVALAEFVVTISDYNKRLIVDECGGRYAEKVKVIHCGVDTHVFQPTPVQVAANRNGKPWTILCIGTLHEVKGQTYLIEACRLLAERGIDAVCHLVGDGPDENALTAQSKQAGLADRMHFHGRRTREQVAELLRQADVVAAPSVPTKDGRREGIPVALMEAMGCGLPVVASRLSGIPELVHEDQCGLLVPPRDAVALAEAIQRMHDDPGLCMRLGQAARERVINEFDLTKNAATLAEHFCSGDRP